MSSLMLQLVLKWVSSDITAFMSVKHLLLVIKFKEAVLRQICFFLKLQNNVCICETSSFTNDNTFLTGLHPNHKLVIYILPRQYNNQILLSKAEHKESALKKKSG